MKVFAAKARNVPAPAKLGLDGAIGGFEESMQIMLDIGNAGNGTTNSLVLA
jgi:hypothetical protein